MTILAGSSQRSDRRRRDRVAIEQRSVDVDGDHHAFHVSFLPRFRVQHSSRLVTDHGVVG